MAWVWWLAMGTAAVVLSCGFVLGRLLRSMDDPRAADAPPQQLRSEQDASVDPAVRPGVVLAPLRQSGA
jgi:hypothetical protein